MPFAVGAVSIFEYFKKICKIGTMPKFNSPVVQSTPRMFFEIHCKFAGRKKERNYFILKVADASADT